MWDEITYPFQKSISHLGMDKKFSFTKNHNHWAVTSVTIVTWWRGWGTAPDTCHICDPLCLSDAILLHRSWSTLAHVLASCLTAWHNWNQCYIQFNREQFQLKKSGFIHKKISKIETCLIFIYKSQLIHKCIKSITPVFYFWELNVAIVDKIICFKFW